MPCEQQQQQHLSFYSTLLLTIANINWGIFQVLPLVFSQRLVFLSWYWHTCHVQHCRYWSPTTSTRRMGMPYRSPNANTSATWWVRVSGVDQLMRSFPAQTSVMAEYSKSLNQISFKIFKKPRSLRLWVKLAPPTMAGWSSSPRPRHRTPANERKRCINKNPVEQCKCLLLGLPAAPWTQGGKSLWAKDHSLNDMRSVRIEGPIL